MIYKYTWTNDEIYVFRGSVAWSTAKATGLPVANRSQGFGGWSERFEHEAIIPDEPLRGDGIFVSPNQNSVARDGCVVKLGRLATRPVEEPVMDTHK